MKGTSMSKIWFPLQRAIRTAVQVIVAAAAILATTVVVAPQIVTAIADVLPGSWVAWLTGAIAALAAVSAAISRVMAIPAVDAWLKKLGAGSAPTGAVAYTPLDGEPVGLTRRQWRDLVTDPVKSPEVASAVAEQAAEAAVDSLTRARQDGTHDRGADA
ncbi:hypothetical protein J2Y69_002301 [Microbacterium resistens]|uniref:Holin n=1 Tax=Microbacterium resistens TaxID=156977 RepID=A0ABU1SFQ1_9MICO|nr:hypothetical protein [Microbacterium resistens]MDR6867697.1 hypothetical protein [Microbacterium resistens]